MEAVARQGEGPQSLAAEHAARDRARRIVGWGAAALTLALFATIPLALADGVMSRPQIKGSGPEPWNLVFVAAFALSGAALIHLRPRNWIGWILVASGLLQVTSLAADAYSARALTDPDQSLPLGLAAAWLASWTWLPSVLLPLLVLPPLYPTGHPPSRYWVWHLRVAFTAIGVAVLVMAFGAGGGSDTVAGTELPFAPPTWTAYVVLPVLGALLVAATGSSIVGTLVRVARATYPERQQLLWLLCVVAAMVATTFTEYQLLFALAYCMVPAAVLVGVLRYHLLGIEVALRRTLLYVPLTLLVALVVGGLSTLVARLAPDGPLALLVASAVVAILVIPVAARLRVLVDRLVLGERVDPVVVVDRLGAGLEVEQANPVSSMLEAVASAVGATSATVRDPDDRLLARVGPPPPDAPPSMLTLPLRHRGSLLGTLDVAPRRGTAEISARDARLLTALAPHLAVVLGSRRLTEELARERNRVMEATLRERARLRADLHDELSPSLAGTRLALAAARDRLGPAGDSPAEGLLAQADGELVRASGVVRGILEDLRPDSLTRLGLVAALRERAAAFDRPGVFTVTVQAEEPLPGVGPAVETAVLRIAGEAVANAARHSHGSQAVVSVAAGADGLLLAVTDDGIGIPALPREGVGLGSMQRRAAAVGGHLEILEEDGGGTLVRGWFPASADTRNPDGQGEM